MNIGTKAHYIILAVLCFLFVAGGTLAGNKSQWIKKLQANSQRQAAKLHATKQGVSSKTLSEIKATLREANQKRNSTSSNNNNMHERDGRISSQDRALFSRSHGGKSAMNDIANFLIMRDVDMTSGGYGGMRDSGNGTLTISYSTPSVSILKAFLYWNGPTNSTDPEANAGVLFNGTEIFGENIGFSDDNCWGYNNSQAYRADVTDLVSSAVTEYALANFVKNSGDVNVNGATLIVFYDDGDSLNNHDYVLFDGNDSNIANDYDAPGWNVMLNGINYTSGQAMMTLHVSDGQEWLDDNVYLNGYALTDTDHIFDGLTVPYDTLVATDKNGSMWDIVNFDITSYLAPGNNDIWLSTGVYDDCLSLVLAVVELPVGSAPSEFGTGKISGMKFSDENNNGLKDESEEGIEDWGIILSGAASDTAWTDPYGNYTFINLLPGTYTVSEIQQEGWTQTSPAETTFTVTIDSGGIVDKLDFGNYPLPGSVTGAKWNDLDGNGYWGEEPGIEGWHIYLLTYDSFLDSIITFDSASTDSNGEFTISNVPMGEYILIEEMRDGWVQTAPYYGYYNVYIDEPGQVVSSNNFGNMESAPVLAYDRECITFPSVAPSQTKTLPLTLTNVGTGNIEIYGFSSLDEAFTANNPGSSTIGTGESVTIDVSFSPPSPGEYISLMIVFTNISTDTIFLAGQGELPASDVGQQIFSGLATMEGSPAPKYSVIVALTTDFQLIKASLIEVSPGEIVDNINYAISIQEGQAGIEEGDTIYFGVSSGCSFMFEKLCGYTVFSPDFPPTGGYTRHDIEGVDFRVLEIPLYDGYNAVSWNVKPDFPAVTDVFFNQLQSGSIKIILDFVNDGITNPRFDFYIPALGEYNPFQVTDFTKGYFVRTSGESIEPLYVWGVPVCNSFPIHVSYGYNFVSYLPQDENDVDNALQSLLPDNLNVALEWERDDDGSGYFNFYPEGGFTTMNEGEGYFVNVNVPGLLTYPDDIEVTKSVAEIKPRQVLSNINLPEAIFAYGVDVTIHGTPISKDTEIKAVDSDGIICGTAKFLADGVFALPIYGDNPSTSQDEGAMKNEQVTVYIGNQQISERVVWKEFGDTPELSGELSVLGVGDPQRVPQEFLLRQNYPNPFNPTTSIKYELPKAATVSLKIYDMLGQEVTTLVAEHQDVGYYRVSWDGKNSAGHAVSSGIYTYRLTANDGVASSVLTQKMIMMK
ncbi:MAG: T9SS type A sorting domain-containing protein [Bacteroidetes bacterium]|nr:MAG: T9SS type A sorting domain-containing protein [Bacteroidota bacterium]